MTLYRKPYPVTVIEWDGTLEGCDAVRDALGCEVAVERQDGGWRLVAKRRDTTVYLRRGESIVEDDGRIGSMLRNAYRYTADRPDGIDEGVP